MSMKKTGLLVNLFFSLFLLVLATGYAAKKNPVVCDSPYILCNAAACEQIPGIKDRALCHCTVWEGKNIGYSTCKQRKIIRQEDGQRKLLSTFSFGGMHYKYMQCPANNPWTNCLDQPCFIDKNDPRKAHCNCKIERGSSYVTFAGMCDSNNCKKSMWSGALEKDNKKFIHVLDREKKTTELSDRKCKASSY